jgi:protein-disulfide isomerase
MIHHRPFELAVPVSAADHMLGSEHAAVTVVEYGDFECPNCKQAAPVVKMLLERFVGRVRIAFRHFPLEEIHPHALAAALAAEAAAGQGKFWPMHDLLFDNQHHLKPSHIRGHAERLELDMERYDADMKDALYLQRVREDIEGGNLAGVRATPTFFVNGKLQDISYGLQALAEDIDAALRPNK